MAIEKALQSEAFAPEINQTSVEEEATLVENPEGSVEYLYEEELLDDIEHDENLVDYLGEKFLQDLASDVIEDQATDRSSRKDWDNTISRGMDLLGLKLETSGAVFEGACTAHHPLIIEAATKFQSKASPELFPSRGPVKTQIIGKVTPEKEEAAKRVQDHLNYQVMEEMEEYFPDKERMLFYLPIVGAAFTKTYWDAIQQRPVSEFVPVETFDVPYDSSDLKRAPRYTQTIFLSENEYVKRVDSGLYSSTVDVGKPALREIEETEAKVASITGNSQSNSERDEVYTILEQHVDLVLPVEAGHPEEKEDIPLPYIVSVEKESSQIISIRRNWKEEDETYQKIVWFTHYSFVPGFGFFGLGYIHLLGNFQMTLTAALRSLVDSGQFANMQGGFKSKQMRIDNDGPISPGEYREVETAGMELQKLIMPLPTKEPSGVLFNMLDYLSAAGQKFADSTEQVVADSTNYGPVGTTMALLEASAKFFTAIHKRLHHAQKHELKLIADLNYMYLPEEGYVYDIVGGEIAVHREDFDGRIDVIPVSDPNISSKAARIAEAETLVEQALRAPDIHDVRAVHKNLYTIMGVENVDGILPPPQSAQPLDPVSDIMAAVQGQPIKAFQGQDHDSHVAVKTAWMQDPTNGQNELMIKTMPILEANLREHMVTKWQEQMQGVVQATGAGTDPNTLAIVQAQAAQQIAQVNKQIALQGALDSPEMMMAKAEVASTQIEATKSERDFQIKSREVDIKEYEARVKAEIEGAKLVLEEEKIDADLSKNTEKAAVELTKAKITSKKQER